MGIGEQLCLLYYITYFAGFYWLQPLVGQSYVQYVLYLCSEQMSLVF